MTGAVKIHALICLKIVESGIMSVYRVKSGLALLRLKTVFEMIHTVCVKVVAIARVQRNMKIVLKMRAVNKHVPVIVFIFQSFDDR